MAIGPIQDAEIFPFLNFVLLAVYSFLYLVLVIDWIKKNPTKVSSIDFSTLRSVVDLFKDEAAVFAGWTHYIAFDLMIARYIVLDAAEEGIPHIFIVPLVPVTLMLGPVGLFSYSIIKSVRNIRFSGSRFAFPSLAEDHKKYWHSLFPESSYFSDALPPTIITKYFDHPDIVMLHVIPAGVWAMLAPIQLLDAARRYAPALHRWTGYVLLSMVPLIVTGLGLILVRQIDIESDYPADLPGPISELGLSPLGDGRSFALYRIGAALLGVYFLTSAALAFLAARRRAFASHRAWMVRHVAAGVSVAAQRWYLGLRGATTAAGGRAAFYDGIFVATAVCLVYCKECGGMGSFDRVPYIQNMNYMKSKYGNLINVHLAPTSLPALAANDRLEHRGLMLALETVTGSAVVVANPTARAVPPDFVAITMLAGRTSITRIAVAASRPASWRSTGNCTHEQQKENQKQECAPASKFHDRCSHPDKQYAGRQHPPKFINGYAFYFCTLDSRLFTISTFQKNFRFL
eukprot:gene34637-44779_t